VSSWNDIDTVFLDMDGNAARSQPDNVLWNGLPDDMRRIWHDETVARDALFAHFETVRHTIDFLLLDYWASTRRRHLRNACEPGT
jgi:hypothetical protein